MRRPIILKPTALVALVLVALAALPAGCSFLFVEIAPPREAWPDSQNSLMTMKGCTETRTPEVIDIGAAVGLASVAPTALVFRHFDPPPPSSGENDVNQDFLLAATAFLMTLGALPFLISGLWGHGEINRCRRYKAGPPYDDYHRGG